MPQYPTAPATFPTRQDGDLIFAEHMNSVQTEIEQITSGLLTGLFHNLLPATDLTYNLGAPSRRWKEVWADSINSGGPITGGPITGTYLDLPELVPPAPGDPAPDFARLHALDANGFSVLEVRDANANVVRLASDNVLIGKVAVAGGIARGQVVYISGAAGANPLIGLAQADAASTLPALGLALDPGANNAFIRVLMGGTIQIINTSAFAEGDRLFVSATTAGSLVNVLPTPPAYAQRIGIVTRAHATQGEIVVVTTGVEAPPVASPPTPHAPSHAAGGGDPVNLLGLAGYPGGTVNFLRADGTFAPPPFAPPPDLSGYVPYVGAVTTVNIGGNAFISGSVSTGALSATTISATGPVDFTGGVGTAYHTAHLEVGNSATPRVSFHWHGVVASQIGMDSSGVIRTFDNPGTSYENFAALNIRAYNNLISFGGVFPGLAAGHGGPGFQSSYGIYGSNAYGMYINTGLYVAAYVFSGTYMNVGTTLDVGGNGTIQGNFFTAGQVYPGRVDIAPTVQGTWYIASHASFGLYTNTGLYVAAGVYVQGASNFQQSVAIIGNLGVGVAASGAPLRIIGLSTGPSVSGDVYNNGDGILRIG